MYLYHPTDDPMLVRREKLTSPLNAHELIYIFQQEGFTFHMTEQGELAWNGPGNLPMHLIHQLFEDGNAQRLMIALKAGLN